MLALFLLLVRRPQSSTLFPYTTLFRSCTFIGKGNTTTPGGDGFFGDIRSTGTGFVSVGGGANSPSHFRSNYSRSEEHTSELQSLRHLVCRLLLEKKK